MICINQKLGDHGGNADSHGPQSRVVNHPELKVPEAFAGKVPTLGKEQGYYIEDLNGRRDKDGHSRHSGPRTKED